MLRIGLVTLIFLFASTTEAAVVMVVTSYSDQNCTQEVGVIAVPSASCVASGCGGRGFVMQCQTFLDPAPVSANCGFDLFGVANCGGNATARLRFTIGQCHNLDSMTPGIASFAPFFNCPAHFKSVRPAGCMGPGVTPGYPDFSTCYENVDCSGSITTTTAITTTSTLATTTPTPSQCKTCLTPGLLVQESSYSYCDAPPATTTTSRGGGTVTTTPTSAGSMLKASGVIITSLVMVVSIGIL